jgi:hypothetical protein
MDIKNVLFDRAFELPDAFGSAFLLRIPGK